MSTASKPTIKNTKSEILSAYEELLQEVDKNKSQRTEEKKSQMKSDVVQRASSQDSKDIIHNVSDLKIQVSESLENLTKTLLHERAKLSELQEAIIIEQNRLKEAHDITISANSLEALLLAQNKKKEEFEQWIELEKDKFKSEMSEKKASWAKESQEYEQTRKEKIELHKKEWSRLEEEYEYQKKITQQKDSDEYQLKKELLHRELQDKKKKFEEEISSRESKITSQEQEILDLRMFKDEAENKLQNRIEEAKKQLIAETEQKYKYQSELLQKETDAESSLLKQKISFLEDKMQEKNNIIDNLTQQLSYAQSQSQDLAKKIIDANAKMHAINNNCKDTKDTKPVDPK